MEIKKSEENALTPIPENPPVPVVYRTRPDAKTVKTYTRQGKNDGAQYLQEKKACSTKDEAKDFRRRWKQYKKDYHRNLRASDPLEKQAQKKGYRAFKHRVHRKSRLFFAVLALALIACLVFLGTPIVQSGWRVSTTQKVSNAGSEVEIARAGGYALSAEVCDEGFILLKNDGDLLPLENRKLCLFGSDAYSFLTGASDGSTVSLAEIFESAGIACCSELTAYYGELLSPKSIPDRVMGLLPGQQEEDGWALPDSGLMTSAKKFSSQALIALSAAPDASASSEALRPMAGDTSRKQLIDTVCTKFDHVILVINSGSVMDLSFLSSYDSIEAVIWAGYPGTMGCSELAGILTGEVNPSGRCTDTWPLVPGSEPSAAVGDGSYYANVSSLQALSCQEGIYVGYRYYETRYGADEKAYAESVLFPFGYGLSYTEFETALTSLTLEDETVTASVTVKNVGDTAGRNVVQLYCMPPYAEESGLEKSVIELAGFAKTARLEPEEEEEISISFPLRSLSSWSEAEGCFVLEKGEYRFAVGDSVHAALLSEAFETAELEEDLRYTEDETTGAKLENRFADASEGLVTLSRSDWDSTFPQSEARLVASDELKQAKKTYELAEGYFAEEKTEPVTGADGHIVLADLKGLDYTDEKWDSFLDQFTIDDCILLTANGAYHTEALSRLGIPSAQLLGGSSGLEADYARLSAVVYPAEIVLGSTWNTSLAAKFGACVAAEAAAYGVDGWYAPDAGIHRCSFSSRNSSSFSEDPLLSGKMAAEVIRSAQDAGLMTFVRDFACGFTSENDTCVWISEQALRELYLRSFEIAVKESGACGVMAASSRLGVEWCGACSSLMKDVLRSEWGFCGIVTSGEESGVWVDAELAVKNGTDLMLDFGWRYSEKVLKAAYDSDPVGTAWSLREAVHNICYTLANHSGLV